MAGMPIKQIGATISGRFSQRQKRIQRIEMIGLNRFGPKSIIAEIVRDLLFEALHAVISKTLMSRGISDDTNRGQMPRAPIPNQSSLCQALGLRPKKVALDVSLLFIRERAGVVNQVVALGHGDERNGFV